MVASILLLLFMIYLQLKVLLTTQFIMKLSNPVYFVPNSMLTQSTTVWQYENIFFSSQDCHSLAIRLSGSTFWSNFNSFLFPFKVNKKKINKQNVVQSIDASNCKYCLQNSSSFNFSCCWFKVSSCISRCKLIIWIFIFLIFS